MMITPQQEKKLIKKLRAFYTNRPVLITGGAGFIGSHIAQLLATYNARITILDNLSTGSWDNIAHIQAPLKKIVGSICDKALCTKLTKNNSIIFHCAAQVSVPESIKDPQTCFESNISGTHTLLHAAHTNKNHTLIFSSSAAVYGNKNTPCSETDTCTPLSPYGYSKYMGELLCQQYAQIYNLPTLCLRYFNVHGPRQNPNGPYAGIVAKLRQCLQYNIPFTVYGTGEQTRDFIPVSTVALYNSICPLLPPQYLNGNAYNCATGTSITINTMIKKICKEYPNYTASIHYTSARTADIVHSAAENSRLQNLFFSGILKKLEK